MIAVIHCWKHIIKAVKLPLRVAMFKHHCLAMAQVTTPPETWRPRSYCNISAQHTPVRWLAALKIMVSHFSLRGHSSKKKKHFPKILLYLYLSSQKSLLNSNYKSNSFMSEDINFQNSNSQVTPPLMLHLFSSLPKLLPSSLNSFFDPSLASVSLLNSFVFF